MLTTTKKEKRIAGNTIMLLVLNAARMFFPFITLPYLTRVLSADSYGVVAYVKAVMNYMQVIVDFGFLLSATKRVVETKGNRKEAGYVIGDNIAAKLILAAAAAAVLGSMVLMIPMLREYVLFTFLSYVVVVLTIFLVDFYFRGIEKMQIITLRFLVMKGLSTFLTFFAVKADEDILWIPILDILGSLAAIVLVWVEIRKEGIRVRCTGMRMILQLIKESSVYFFSNVASTSFNAFATILMGMSLNTEDIAFWSVCTQIVYAAQSIYIPVSDALYPEMIRSKDISLIKKVIKIFMPLITLGCGAAYFLAELGLYIVGGRVYVEAADVFRMLIPVIFFGFPSIIFGWPVLGAIGKVKETTRTTVTAVVLQIICYIVLLACGQLTLMTMAVIRSMTEMLLFILRYCYYRSFRYLFAGKEG